MSYPIAIMRGAFGSGSLAGLEGFTATRASASGTAGNPVENYDTPHWNPQGDFDPVAGSWTPSSSGLAWISCAGFPQGGMSGGGGSNEWQLEIRKDGVLIDELRHREYSQTRAHGGCGFVSGLIEVTAGDVYKIQQQTDIAQNVVFSAYMIPTTTVAVAATKASSSGSADGVIANFGAELFDYDNNFDPVTGEFTAPSDGYYLVGMQGFPEGGMSGTSQRCEARPFLDGVGLSHRVLYEIGRSDGQGQTIGRSILIFMSAGEVLTHTQKDDTYHTVYFSVAKVSPTVAFAAHKVTATGVNGDVISGYDTVDFDLGSDFNAVSGVFTAPSAGLYHLMGFSQGVASDTETQTQLLIDGSEVAKARNWIQTSAHRGTPVVSMVRDMAAGETASITQFNTGADAYFAGWKIA